MKRSLSLLFAFVFVLSHSAMAQENETHPDMSFFITSAGPGNGANLGGLSGADDFCTLLAESVGVEGKEWAAYLSASAEGENKAINARDRIGSGPWFNAKGVLIANNVDELHSDKANLTKEASLNEMGELVNGRGDAPNMHDILTGSTLNGFLVAGSNDSTCSNWTTSSEEGSAMVGHHDRQGGGANPTSWNSAHPSRGCSQQNLQSSGGNGLYYCLAKK